MLEDMRPSTHTLQETKQTERMEEILNLDPTTEM